MQELAILFTMKNIFSHIIWHQSYTVKQADNKSSVMKTKLRLVKLHYNLLKMWLVASFVIQML